MTAAITDKVKNLVADGLAKIGEAQEFLKVSRATVYKLMETGQLAYVKIGGSRRIPWKALHQLVERSLFEAKG
jgi:excisionase family DNA binding protein